ncbi:MAG: prepilin-type N-terminal cleavage/methylation domain-containing protein [Gammaproteobacteria bacterium]|nr:prepilin-type N-terminal cleavage/methylation domain-containing protein [Gammaproteobacteria bacterium]
MRKHMRGVTLIELMIVVVVVSILAAVAFPNYREYAARAKRNEARAALLQLATNQERFYLNNNTFSADMTDLGFANDPFTTDSGSYVVDVTAASASNFSATATYQLGGSEATKCLTFTLDGRGVKTSGPDTNCWVRKR